MQEKQQEECTFKPNVFVVKKPSFMHQRNRSAENQQDYVEKYLYKPVTRYDRNRESLDYEK